MEKRNLSKVQKIFERHIGLKMEGKDVWGGGGVKVKIGKDC